MTSVTQVTKPLSARGIPAEASGMLACCHWGAGAPMNKGRRPFGIMKSIPFAWVSDSVSVLLDRYVLPKPHGKQSACRQRLGALHRGPGIHWTFRARPARLRWTPADSRFLIPLQSCKFAKHRESQTIRSSFERGCVAYSRAAYSVKTRDLASQAR